MSTENWQVSFKIFRQRHGDQSHYQIFSINVNPDEYVLDAIERIWAFEDRSLTFRHACHHSTCGACGMRINGVEKLTCVTSLRSVTRDGGQVLVEPLRNFEILSDLVVDMGPFFRRMGQTNFSSVAPIHKAALSFEVQTAQSGDFERLVDCIECGLCISACPAAMTHENYVGPAVLASIHLMLQQKTEDFLLHLADNEFGAWRCHSAFECSEVCPSNVDPGWRIMNLRGKIVSHKIKSFLKIGVKDPTHE